MEQKRRLRGHLLALGTILFWGCTFISSKVLLTALTPIQILAYRFFIAYGVLWLLYPKTAKAPWRDELRFMLLGVFGCSVYLYLENTALTYTLASNVSIIVASAPILTTLLARLFLRGEPFHRNLFLGFLLAFIGVGLVVFNGAVVLQLNPRGDLLALLAALSWSVYSVLIKSVVGRYPVLLLTRRVMLYGSLTALPMLFWEGAPLRLGEIFSSPSLLFNLLFLGVICSAVGYGTWNTASSILGIVATNNYIYINPFVTMVCAALVLGEPITLMGICGAVLIIGGIILSSRRVGTVQEAPPAQEAASSETTGSDFPH